MSLADIDRPLNKRGKRDALEMGRRLAEQGVRPDVILSSPAKRACKNAGKLAKAMGLGRERILIRDELYGAASDELLEVIRGLGDKIATAAIVGHNPEITVLANMLGNLDVDNVVTGGVVAYDFDVGSWQKVKRGMGKLAFYDYPARTGAADSS